MNKKILTLLILGIFIFSLVSVSAVVKSYDKETNTVTLKKDFLFIPIGDIAEAQLKTPIYNKVGIGYVRVAEFEVRGKDDWADLFYRNIKTYDKQKFDKGEETELNREFDWKYKTTETYLIDDYTCNNQTLINGTETNNCFVSGTHEEEREVWLPFDTQKKIKKDEIITIGLYTTNVKGDYVEWIPNFAGKEVPEWASWSASLDVGLLSSYSFEEPNGSVVIDNVTGNNGYPVGVSKIQGKVGSAYYYPQNQVSYINLGTGTNLDRSGDLSINAWVYLNESSTGQHILSNWASNWIFYFTNNEARGISSGGGNIATEPLSSNEWHMVTFVREAGGDLSFYIDGVLNITDSPAGAGSVSGINLTIGSNGVTAVGGDTFGAGIIDELLVYNISISQESVTSLYNGGLGCSYQDCITLTPTITLNSPTNDTTTSNPTINFNGTITGETPLNVSLIIDDVYNETNTSGDLGDYVFEKIFTDGIYTWNYESCAVAGCVNGTERTFTIDTTPFIEFLTPPTLVNYANITDEIIPIGVNVSTLYFFNISYDLYNINGTQFNQYYETETFEYNFTDIPDSHYHYNVTVCTTTGRCNVTETRHINHDVTPPRLPIDSPTGEYNYLYVGQPLELNFTAIDELANVSECFWNYNGTNNSIACTNATLLSVPISQEYGQTTGKVYANDTFGNEGFNSTTWTFKILELNKTFNNETTEGAYEKFYLYMNKGSGYNIQSVNLNYNGQSDVASLFSSGDNVTAISEILIDGVSADINKTFYFTVTLTDGTVFNTTSEVQLVHDITIDDCSANPYPLLYLYLKDEEARTLLNGTIETNIEIVNNFNYAQILNITQEETSVNYIDLCSNIALNETAFLLNAEIRYNSENHSAEFYHIQRAALSSYPANVSLFDLKTEDTTKFKILYRNQDLIGIEGAILQLQRKYISDGIYEVVEAPITSSDSSSILHIDTNTNKYQITVVKNGEVLGLFQNLAFICQSELTGECTLNLYDKLVPPNIVPLVDLQDFSSGLESSIDNQTITLTYVVPSGTSTSIRVLAIQKDTILGESVICNQTVFSSSGSIECSYSTTIQDSTIDYKVFKAEELIAQKGFAVQEDLRDEWDGVNYFLLVLLMLSLVFMALSSPEWIVINAVLTVLIGGGIWLIRGIGFIEGLGSLMWLVIAAVILISKLSQQEDY